MFYLCLGFPLKAYPIITYCTTPNKTCQQQYCKKSHNFLSKVGGADGTRTRDHSSDSAVF